MVYPFTGPAWSFSSVSSWTCTDLVAGFHADPLWNWPVLLHLLSEESLHPEGFVGWHGRTSTPAGGIGCRLAADPPQPVDETPHPLSPHPPGGDRSHPTPNQRMNIREPLSPLSAFFFTSGRALSDLFRTAHALFGAPIVPAALSPAHWTGTGKKRMGTLERGFRGSDLFDARTRHLVSKW